MEFVIVMSVVILVYTVLYGSNGIISEEYEINEFLKKYQYSIILNNDILQKAVLYKLCCEDSGANGKGIFAFIMFYRLLYIVKFSSSKELALKKIFEKSKKPKKKSPFS